LSSRSKPTAKLEIDPLTLAELERITQRPVTFPIAAWGGYRTVRKKRKLVAYGGLAWRFIPPGQERPRCDIFLDVVDGKLLSGLTLVRWAQRMLRVAVQMGEEAVYCIRDDEPNSARLLELVGMTRIEDVAIKFDDGSKRTGEIYVWRRSQLSPPSSGSPAQP